jgi:hypothetical protein
MIVMHAGSNLRLVDLETVSKDANRIDPKNKITAIDLLPWTPVPITMWTGPGGLRAPDWPLPALCPGANWN